MTRLRALFEEQGQSPWLANLKRPCLRSGRFESYVQAGVRGVAATSIVLDGSTEGASAYDPQIASLTQTNLGVEDIYWELVIADVTEALSLLTPLYDSSKHNAGFVSLGLQPLLAHDVSGTIATALSLRRQIDFPNLLIAIPATNAGITSIRKLTAEGIGTNATQIFSLRRYQQVLEAYMSGLESCVADVSTVHSVASFSLSEVDATVDALLRQIDDPEVPALVGRAASCQAKLAYQIFMSWFSSSRWSAISIRGANVQQLAWVSDLQGGDGRPGSLCYVDRLIGPNTITAMSERTLATFESFGGPLVRTLDADTPVAAERLERLAAIGIKLENLSGGLEADSLAAATRAYGTALVSLSSKARLHSGL